MKKKLFFGLSGFACIAFVLLLLWPLSFMSVIGDSADLAVILIDLELKNGVSQQTTTDYVFSPHSDEFKQIRQILSRYSFHRSPSDLTQL